MTCKNNIYIGTCVNISDSRLLGIEEQAVHLLEAELANQVEIVFVALHKKASNSQHVCIFHGGVRLPHCSLESLVASAESHHLVHIAHQIFQTATAMKLGTYIKSMSFEEVWRFGWQTTGFRYVLSILFFSSLECKLLAR